MCHLSITSPATCLSGTRSLDVGENGRVADGLWDGGAAQSLRAEAGVQIEAKRALASSDCGWILLRSPPLASLVWFGMRWQEPHDCGLAPHEATSRKDGEGDDESHELHHR